MSKVYRRGANGLAILPSPLVALAVWVVLLVLHRIWFTHFLTNAPGVQRL